LNCFCIIGCLFNDWLIRINHGTKFWLINSYSRGPRIRCYTALIPFVPPNQL
jgi:hypothetical protein